MSAVLDLHEGRTGMTRPPEAGRPVPSLLELSCSCRTGPHAPCWACAAWRRVFWRIRNRTTATAGQVPQRKRAAA